MLAAMQMADGSGTMPLAMPELSDREFRMWAMLLESRLGVAVTEQRKGFLSSKLRLRMRELGIDDFQRYYTMVTASGKGQVEWTRLLEKLTVHETRFFRHRPSFCLLEEQYLPELLRQPHSGILNIRAWSVGCASGEEAYSLAMLLDRSLAGYQGKAYFGVIGTDISLESLSEARRGVYAEQRLQSIDSVMAADFLVPCSEGYKVADSLRRRVAFSQLNIQKLTQAPLEKMDIIFCQNVLIYFAQQKRMEIVNSLTRFLKPGGILVLGVGEIMGWQPEGLKAYKYQDTLAYRKIKD